MKFIDFPKMNVKIEGMESIKIPRMINIRQLYDKNKIADLAAHTARQMEENLRDKAWFKDKRIGITAGSRGIPQLDLIIKTIVDKLIEWGARPFIVPAMGSHGGGTAEGQAEMIAGYGITEQAMGVPILSSMDVVQIGSLADGTPVYCDKYAYESDGIVALNKVKPHTDFRARHESGILKMLTIGLGNHLGASMFHMMGVHTFAERIPQVFDVFMENAPLCFGVGIIQNAYDEISELEVMEKELILERDAAMQEIAKSKIARFKIPAIDVLVIDEIGKNISGNGHDPNITARGGSPGFENIIDLKKLFIRGLTEETHHNACGLSCADITTRRCLNNVDFETTWVNVVTSTILGGGKIPMYMETDLEALKLAIRTCNGIDFDRARVVRIKNTLCMEYIQVSEVYYDEIRDNPEIEILSGPQELRFDADGFMEPLT